MSEISPRPWKIIDDNGYNAIVDDNGVSVLDSYDEYSMLDEDAELIIKCVNEHDKLKEENAKLKEALQKCSPYGLEHDDCDNSCTYCCVFCGESYDKEHLKGCEYIGLY